MARDSPDEITGYRVCLHPSRIPTRVVLGILSFFGFFVNYMLRVNMNIAIVSMTFSAIGNGNISASAGECLPEPTNVTLKQESDLKNEAEFSWDAHEQALVLGSFYWSYIFSPIPGGMLAERYGAKIVYGGANLVHGVMALLTPIAARWNFTALVGARLLQGLVSGMTWPAMHVMTSRWIPPHERSKFVATYLGNSVGTAVTFPLCGLLIDIFGSWVWAFYIPGSLGLLWCVFWFFLAYDAPSEHPRISQREKAYLQRSVAPHLGGKKRLPWLKVARSVPVWALLISNIGSVWGFMTIITYAPTYLKTVHGFQIRENGFLSGLPNVSRFIVAVIFSWFVDSLIKSQKCTVTFARKMATCIAHFLPAMLFLLMGRVGCNAAAEVAILTILAALGGCVAAGSIVNSVDLAPNFSGTIMGIVSVVSMSSGFVVPLIVSAIIEHDQSIAQWRYVFTVAAVCYTISAIVYVIWGSGEEQPWNKPADEDEKNTELRNNT